MSWFKCFFFNVLIRRRAILINDFFSSTFFDFFQTPSFLSLSFCVRAVVGSWMCVFAHRFCFFTFFSLQFRVKHCKSRSNDIYFMVVMSIRCQNDYYACYLRWLLLKVFLFLFSWNGKEEAEKACSWCGYTATLWLTFDLCAMNMIWRLHAASVFIAFDSVTNPFWQSENANCTDFSHSRASHLDWLKRSWHDVIDRSNF